MAAAIALRTDYDGGRLGRLAKASDDAKQAQRLPALAVIDHGGRRGEAAAAPIIAQWIFEEFGITLDETSVGRTLKAMGFRKLSARPRH